MTIDSDSSRLSEADVEKMLANAEKHKEQDAALKESASARMSLEQSAFALRNYITGPELQEADLADLTDSIEKVQAAIDEAAEFADMRQTEPKEVYEEKQRELKELAQPLVDALGEILDAMALKAEEEAAGNQEEQPPPEEGGDDTEHEEL